MSKSESTKKIEGMVDDLCGAANLAAVRLAGDTPGQDGRLRDARAALLAEYEVLESENENLLMELETKPRPLGRRKHGCGSELAKGEGDGD